LAQQKILWQGAVIQEQINVYENASTKEHVVSRLRQGDVVDVVLQIRTSGDAWCRVSFAGASEPLGYVLCLNLKRGQYTSKQTTHTEPIRAHPQATPAASVPVVKTSDSAALSNNDILDMHKAGLPPEVLIAKIKSSQCGFDTSPSQLTHLKSKGVTDAVILAMVEAPTGQPKPFSPADPAQASPITGSDQTSVSQDSTSADIQSLADGFYYRTSQGWHELEPISMVGGGAKHVGKMLIPGLTPQFVWTFRGAEAPVQTSDRRPVFCVKESPAVANVEGRTWRDLIIVRFDKEKDHRELQTTNGGNMFTFKAGLSKDRTPGITVNPISDGTFTVTPNEDLRPGEYMLTFGALGNSGYDFGIR
jgi:hypothetical protein